MLSGVTGTTSRALALLDLLQTRRRWTGAELTARLEVTERTLRRDVERLRALGYEVTSSRGTGGGYRLAAGVALPPLLLTDDEAVTVALGLRTVAVQGLVGGEHTTLTALAKLEQVLPQRLRRRVAALGEHLNPISTPGSAVAPELLGELALACRDGERIRFRYTAASGAVTDRVVEPSALVASQRAWFLVGYDRDRQDWRTFRVDRAGQLLRLGVRDPRREVPGGDAAALVAERLQSAWPTDRMAQVVVDLPLEVFRAHLGRWGEGAYAEGDAMSVWPIDASSTSRVLAALAWLPVGVSYELRADNDVRASVAAAASGAVAATGESRLRRTSAGRQLPRRNPMPSELGPAADS